MSQENLIGQGSYSKVYDCGNGNVKITGKTQYDLFKALAYELFDLLYEFDTIGETSVITTKRLINTQDSDDWIDDATWVSDYIWEAQNTYRDTYNVGWNLNTIKTDELWKNSALSAAQLLALDIATNPELPETFNAYYALVFEQSLTPEFKGRRICFDEGIRNFLYDDDSDRILPLDAVFFA